MGTCVRAAARSAELDTCYFLPTERFAGQAWIHLRIDPTKNAQRGAILWALEFEFSTIDWDSLGAVAQLEERLTGSQEAGGSSPPSSTSSRDKPVLRMVGAHRFRNH
jgi:hypothetical protein